MNLSNKTPVSWAWVKLGNGQEVDWPKMVTMTQIFLVKTLLWLLEQKNNDIFNLQMNITMQNHLNAKMQQWVTQLFFLLQGFLD